MWLRVEHTTTFTYEAPIVEAYTELRMRPLDSDGQRCSSFQLATIPGGVRIREYRDQLGNAVNHFDVLEPHDRLVVTARSDILTPAQLVSDAELSPLELHDYLRPSSYITLDGAVGEFAVEHAETGTVEERAGALMAAVHSTLSYGRGATTVQTPVEEVLALGRGVCQDFAHLLIAACRCANIPARYVSGYVYEPALAGEAASHAWADVYDTHRGWLSFDPTHNQQQDEHYVRVAVGRDYADVPPTRGVFKGATQESLTIHVEVHPH